MLRWGEGWLFVAKKMHKKEEEMGEGEIMVDRQVIN
jgi:hypothetical protein